MTEPCPCSGCTGRGLSSLAGYPGILPQWQNPCFPPLDFRLSSLLTFLSNAKAAAPFRKLLLFPPWPGVSPSSQSQPSEHISTRDLWRMGALLNIYLKITEGLSITQGLKIYFKISYFSPRWGPQHPPPLSFKVSPQSFSSLPPAGCTFTVAHLCRSFFQMWINVSLLVYQVPQSSFILSSSWQKGSK